MHLLLNISILACLARIVLAATHQVAVGENGLVFTPNTTVAAVGDNVIFTFYPMRHNVVQGPFDTPCKSGDNTGFYSGFIPSSSGPANRTFEITINNTSPIWFYCSQQFGGGHCTAGMVGVINPPSASSGNTTMDLASYAAAAKNMMSSAYSQPAEVQGGVLAAFSGNASSGSGSSSSMSATGTATGSGSGGAGATQTSRASGTGTATGSGTRTASAAATGTTNAAVVGHRVEGWGVGAVVGGLALALL